MTKHNTTLLLCSWVKKTFSKKTVKNCFGSTFDNFGVKHLQNHNIRYEVRKPERHKKCNGSRWWRGGVDALMWHGVAYNDGNGCSHAAQAQHFPMHALKLPLLQICI